MIIKKWNSIAKSIREKIENGVYQRGEGLPTTLELAMEYNCSPTTIQKALKKLYEDGQISLIGKTRFDKKRIVTPVVRRTNRIGGFSHEYGEDGKQEILELDILYSNVGLPADVLKYIESPVLFKKTLQYKGEIPVAISNTFIPSFIDHDRLKRLIYKEKYGLYESMQAIGHNPIFCEEIVHSRHIKDEERALLNVYSHLTIIDDVIRKVYDESDNLLEISLISARAEYYNFVYRFNLWGDK